MSKTFLMLGLSLVALHSVACSVPEGEQEPVERSEQASTTYYGGGCMLIESPGGEQEYQCITPDACEGLPDCDYDVIEQPGGS